jgi:hypothetical protein
MYRLKGCQQQDADWSLVTRYIGVDDSRPPIDSSSKRLSVLEALFAEPHSHRKRTCSVVTENDNRLIGIELLMRTRGYVAHWHEDRLRKVCGVKLPWLSNVQQEGGIGLFTLQREGFDRDLRREHEIKDIVRVTQMPIRKGCARSCKRQSLKRLDKLRECISMGVQRMPSKRYT